MREARRLAAGLGAMMLLAAFGLAARGPAARSLAAPGLAARSLAAPGLAARSLAAPGLAAPPPAARSLTAPSLAAEDHGSDIRMRLEAGFEGWSTLGARVPVRVSISAARLVRGTLTVTVSGRDDSVRQAVEVPGGSRKQFVLLLPTPPFGGGRVRVELRDTGGRVLARKAADLHYGPDTELAGLLPGALPGGSLPGAAPLSVDVGVARFGLVDEALLDLAPFSLDALGTLAATPSDLQRLSGPQREGLLAWVARGGRLLVDAKPGQVVPGLPEAWQPGPDGRSVAGQGEVVLTGGAMTAGRWDRLVEPTVLTPPTTAYPTGLDLLTDQLTSEAGLKAPPLGVLSGLLVLYALGAGPVAFLSLRRRRRILVWVLIPAIALTLTGLSIASSLALRTGVRAVHATTLSSSEGGTFVSTFVGVFAAGGGQVNVRFPGARTGWGGGRNDSVSVDPDGVTVLADVHTAQFVMVGAGGPARGLGGLRVTARSVGADIEGTVRNDTPYRIQEAYVVVGKEAVRVGTLRPGEEQPWRLAGSPSRAHYELVGPDLWPQVLTPQRSVVNYGLWVVRSSHFIEPGTALAVGWTRDHRPEVVISGRRLRPAGRTMIVGRAPVSYGTGPVPPLAVRVEQVRGPAVYEEGPGSDQMTGSDPLVLRFRLPEGAPPRLPLVLRGPATLLKVEVWQDGWRTVFEQQGGQAAGPGVRRFFPPPPPVAVPIMPGGGIRRSSGPEIPMRDIELPPGLGPVVYVRVTQPDYDPHSSWAYSLRERT